MDRREFLSKVAWAGGSTLLPWRCAFAQTGAVQPQPVLTVIFLRGAQDSLSVLAPAADPIYRGYRPNLSLAAESTLKFDGLHAHPALANLLPWWESKNLAFIHQFGSPDVTRSHFDAQDYMESGTPGVKATEDGFLNRLLSLEADRKPLGVALQPDLPRLLRGPANALSMSSLKSFQPPTSTLGQDVGAGLERLYAQAADYVLKGIGEESFRGTRDLKNRVASIPEGDYPKSRTADRLKDIARLIKAAPNLQIAVTEMGGWDTHVGQGVQDGAFFKRMTELTEALAAYAKDLGPQMSRVITVVVTEFGRTVKENGNKGTDHGHGSVAWILGGPVKGGRVLNANLDLKEDKLYEGRDLPVVTDYRSLFAAILKDRLKSTDMTKVFPGWTGKPLEGLI